MALSLAIGAGTAEDSEYEITLRDAVCAALDFGLAGIERGEEGAGAVPTALLVQARRDARSGISLDTVLRRYIAGHALLGDFVIQATERCDLPLRADELRRVWRVQAALLDRLAVAVADEYTLELKNGERGPAERRLERVKTLLAGGFVEPTALRYEFDAWHLGAVAEGPGAGAVLKDLAAKLDRRGLFVSPRPGAIWGWLGGRRRVSGDELARVAPAPWPAGLSLAFGEPERGLAGWRLSHRQAQAAFPVALRPRPRMIRYSEVALLASALRDDVLASSLQRLYLDPLAHERDGGTALRRTLRAYFSAGRNVSSAAASLGVSRQTVTSRLRAVEERIGRTLDACGSEIDTALRIQDLGLGGANALSATI